VFRSLKKIAPTWSLCPAAFLVLMLMLCPAVLDAQNIPGEGDCSDGMDGPDNDGYTDCYDPDCFTENPCTYSACYVEVGEIHDPAVDGTSPRISNSVSIFGDVAVAGAPDEIEGGVVIISTRTASVPLPDWDQEQVLENPNGVSGDRFGWSVSNSNDVIVVGAPDTNSGEGKAYVYEINPNGTPLWTLAGTLESDNPQNNSQFGYAVSTDGTTIVVTELQTYLGSYLYGTVHTFEKNGSGQWIPGPKLDNPHLILTSCNPQGGLTDRYGHSVDISSDLIVVGAPEYDFDSQSNPNGATNCESGCAWVWERGIGNSWSQTSQLLASNPSGSNDQFGHCVSVARRGNPGGLGYRIAVGDPESNDAIYLFDYEIGFANAVVDSEVKIDLFTLADMGYLTNYNEDTGRLGSSCSLNDSGVLAFGCPTSDYGGDYFESFVFQNIPITTSTSEWYFSQSFASEVDPGRNEWGFSVDIWENKLVIGGPLATVIGGLDEVGRAYIYECDPVLPTPLPTMVWDGTYVSWNFPGGPDQFNYLVAIQSGEIVGLTDFDQGSYEFLQCILGPHAMGIIDGAGIFEEIDGIEVTTCPDVSFKRGDANGDSGFNIGDAVFLLGALFSGGDPCLCDDACDGNDDGATNIADAVMMLGALFSGGAAPPAPGPNSCGPDPTSDALDCDEYSGCP
jgi:hypothetical protein